jgi:hypothetical protein
MKHRVSFVKGKAVTHDKSSREFQRSSHVRVYRTESVQQVPVSVVSPNRETTEKNILPLRDEVMNDMAVDVGQSEISPLVAVGQFSVVNAQKM